MATAPALPPAPAAPTPPTRKRVLIVDDHALLRCGWHHLLAPEEDLEICAEAGSVAEALRAVDQALPDVVVTDISLPDRNGLELVKELKALHPEIPVLVVSMHDEKLFGERVLKAGGWGYLMKESASEELVVAIRHVLKGEAYVSPALSARLLAVMVHGNSTAFPLDSLSDRELEIFTLLGSGRSQEEIASQLRIKPRTVEAHRTNIREKLKLPNSAALLRFAIRWFAAEHGSP